MDEPAAADRRCAAARLGGDKGSGRIEAHGPLILSLVEAKG
ncbi:hypothetical protein [uncultured Phenylobacterium sp.]|nr:hypothetical protein [uncultured Phenylobacterium sp.]